MASSPARCGRGCSGGARIERVVDPAQQAGADFGLVAVADGLEQQVLEAHLLEDFAQDVEDAAPERLALDVELLEQAVEDIAFAGFLGDEVPEVADLLSGRCGGCGRSAVRGGSGSTAGRS